jgi:hypothetical protein
MRIDPLAEFPELALPGARPSRTWLTDGESAENYSYTRHFCHPGDEALKA